MNRHLLQTLAAAVLLSASAHAAATDYEVTITNLTRNQVFSPILAVSHKRGIQLFSAGDMVSAELAAIAEGGDTAPLEGVLANTAEVMDFANSGAPLPPGMSASILVQGAPYTRISVVSMLVNTNDAFLALNSEPVSIWRGADTYALAWDAGSEANTELCADIPGPACPADSGNAHVDGEGFIHIHNGIHGVGDADLDPAEYDWHNPVAQIQIHRVRR